MVRERILEIFATCRADARAPFEEKDFLRFLRKSGRREDTFAWRARFVRFMNGVEMEFSICFPESAWDKTWDLQEFTMYVENRARKPGMNLRLAESHLHSSGPVPFPLFAIILVTMVFLPFIVVLHAPYRWILAAVPGALDAVLVYWAVKSWSHDKALVALIRRKVENAENTQAS
jgi:hypothetical protein